MIHKSILLLIIISLSSFLYSKEYMPAKIDRIKKDVVKINHNDIQYIKQSKDKNKIIQRLKNYTQLIKSTKNISNIKKIIRVNNYFNEYKYEEDINNYSQEDYWATRKEFIIKGSGDCEDYAIAKFITLLELGIPKKSISLHFASYENKFHLVVLYKQNNISYVLDNTNKLVLSIDKRQNIKLLQKINI